MHPKSEHLLDWFHVTMRLTVIGLLKFKDRESAKRTLEWVKSRVQKEHTGQVPDF
jgi:hypothetical protein